jgi:hypothetical protein
MQANPKMVSRRAVIQGMLLTAAATVLPPFNSPAQSDRPETKPIPGTGEKIPLVGLVGYPHELFSAEKVWISNPAKGPDQIEQSLAYWSVPRFDLLQIHNHLSWKGHLKTLREMKAASKVRYLGITTSEGRGHGLFEEIMRTQPLDFVQLTYNIVDREAEARILPLARERRIAVDAFRNISDCHFIVTPWFCIRLWLCWKVGCYPPRRSSVSFPIRWPLPLWVCCQRPFLVSECDYCL